MTTVTMIEKVAKAIFEADWPKDDWDRFGEKDHVRERYRELARAAVEAVRVPTPEMTGCSEDVASAWGYSCPLCGGPKENWDALFQAALRGS